MDISRYGLPRSAWASLIDEWVYNERDRRLIKRRLLDGIHLEPLAEEFELSVQQTKSIIYRTQKTLIEHIKQP